MYPEKHGKTDAELAAALTLESGGYITGLFIGASSNEYSILRASHAFASLPDACVGRGGRIHSRIFRCVDGFNQIESLLLGYAARR